MQYIFETNFAELHKLFIMVKDEKNIIEIIRTGNKEVFNAYSYEFTRHFFNFIVATKAYIDQTRRWINKYYKETELKQFYDEKIKEYFIDNNLCKFIQELRNYQSHYTIPFTSYNASFSNSGPSSFMISVKKDRLLEYDKWSMGARAYIEEFEDDINVEIFCYEYYKLVNKFYEEFWEKIKIIHRADFDELEEVKEVFRQKYPLT